MESISNSQDDIDAMLADLDATGDDEPAAAASDVLELTEAMAVPAPTNFSKIDGNDDIEFTEQPAAPPPAPKPAPIMEQVEAAVTQQMPLVSTQTVSAVNSAFNALANTVLSQNARTLEDLVREMLRPMLKSWLDDNLPGMVERLVKAEIERVSRGR